MARVYLSLGSNIEPHRYLSAALAELHGRFAPIAVSPAYRSASVGFDGPDFVNLAVGLDTDMDPYALNAWLHALEDRHGRRRDVPRFASRTLDIDIVLYDDLILDGPGHMNLPRDELRHAFVLRPLADIAPDVAHPITGETMAELWERAAPTAAALVIDPLEG
jgi:2-amino-4-hydroxy-6-hydroxymethyldihydropteridine diphosphokinase